MGVPQRFERDDVQPQALAAKLPEHRDDKASSGTGKLTKDNPVMLQLTKTKMCAFFTRGKCASLDCRYAHSAAELRSPPNLQKTKLCRAFLQGECQDGENCGFAHGEGDLRVTRGVYKTQMCNFFERGYCKKGDRCNHAHGVSDLRPAANDGRETLRLSGATSPMAMTPSSSRTTSAGTDAGSPSSTSSSWTPTQGGHQHGGRSPLPLAELICNGEAATPSSVMPATPTPMQASLADHFTTSIASMVAATAATAAHPRVAAPPPPPQGPSPLSVPLPSSPSQLPLWAGYPGMHQPHPLTPAAHVAACASPLGAAGYYPDDAGVPAGWPLDVGDHAYAPAQMGLSVPMAPPVGLPLRSPPRLHHSYAFDQPLEPDPVAINLSERLASLDALLTGISQARMSLAEAHAPTGADPCAQDPVGVASAFGDAPSAAFATSASDASTPVRVQIRDLVCTPPPVPPPPGIEKAPGSPMTAEGSLVSPEIAAKPPALRPPPGIEDFFFKLAIATEPALGSPNTIAPRTDGGRIHKL